VLAIEEESIHALKELWLELVFKDLKRSGVSG
jgi:hypothetical protein